LRRRNRSKTAASSFPVSGDGHSFDAATQSFSGTGRATPSPASKVRSLRIRRRVLRTADDALNTSSRKATSAVGSLPVVTRTYRSSLRPARETGPNTSSGTVNLVRRMANLVPPVQARRASRRRLLAHPGGETRRRCSAATRAVRARSISSSRSMRAAARSVRAAANFAWTARGSMTGGGMGDSDGGGERERPPRRRARGGHTGVSIRGRRGRRAGAAPDRGRRPQGGRNGYAGSG